MSDVPVLVEENTSSDRAPRSRPQVQGEKIDYQLHTLGWAAFQDLCASIFEVVFDRPVNFFSKTHDGGRDGSFKGLVNERLSVGEQRTSTIQTKHVSRSNSSLTLAQLTEELEKARMLVQSGSAHAYVIMTNAVVTATEAQKIESAFRAEGVLEVSIFGRDWINRKIHENPKIRATVPRLYGLGDLSWIVDERAIAQATEVLGSLGNDMRCYVRTKAHLKAVDALLKHGFVLLIGEPAAGKSTIAANLAMAAIDINGCDVIRVIGPRDIVTHWNPKEKDRFFWVDDAFGATQYDRDSADLWNKVLPTMSAALRCGNRFVLTSRDYIWRQALQDLKVDSFRPLTEGRVVIYTEDLTKGERERILYNHIKFGDQPRSIRRWMKPNLEHIASLNNFKPEIARRLGSAFFTRDLTLSPEGLQQFVDAPRRFLADVIKQLDAAAQAAVALIFLNGGRIASPIAEDASTTIIEATLGVSHTEIKPALEHLNNTLFIHVTESGQTFWMYKHPTISDAYAALISERPELIEIYLRGAKTSSIVNEVVYGTKKVAGASLRVPRTLFPVLSSRLRELSPRLVRMFLLLRTDTEFRQRHLELDARVLSDEIGFSNPIVRDSQAQFFVTAGREGLLSKDVHQAIVERFKSEIVDYGDVTFLLDDSFVSFLGDESHLELLEAAHDELAPAFAELIANIASDCDEDDPDGYFDESKSALEALRALFPNDEDVSTYIEATYDAIQEAVDEVNDKVKDTSESGWHDEAEDQFGGSRHIGNSSFSPEKRSSIFDDIDI